MELEEAGEKWRAGDAAKSMRFFMRAIANYDDGLVRHPDAFDLAYNKYVVMAFLNDLITSRLKFMLFFFFLSFFLLSRTQELTNYFPEHECNMLSLNILN